MEAIPLKLNFFKQAELFLKLRTLDRQYDEMISKYTPEHAKKVFPESEVNINLPTWNLEKKFSIGLTWGINT